MRLNRKSKSSDVVGISLLTLLVFILYVGAILVIIDTARFDDWPKRAPLLFISLFAFAAGASIAGATKRMSRNCFGYNYLEAEKNQITVHWKNATTTVFPLPDSLKQFDPGSGSGVTILLGNGEEQFRFSTNSFQEDESTVMDGLSKLFPLGTETVYSEPTEQA